MTSPTSPSSASVPPPHPARELLARYGAILTAAWQARAELAGPKRLADEAAFLPAALSLQETPVHPAPRRAMAVIVALFLVVLGWACIGEVDIVAVAPGRIVVSERSKVIQPLEAGVVKSIRVQDGDRVQAGQVLLELDPTQAQADHRSVQEQARAIRSESDRLKALLTALRGGPAPQLPPSASAEDRKLLMAEWADITGRLARLQADISRRQAELGTVREMILKLETTLPLARRRESDIKALSDEGMVAAHASQDRTRERIEMERDLAAQQARLAEANAALAESRQAHAAAMAEILRTLNERLAKAQNELTQLDQQGSKSAQREQLTRLTAPVAGKVQQLAVHTSGGVVTPAQVLMVIVPEEAALTAEVAIANTDIGFVREGQEVAVKLETFSFTRYGTVSAKVQRVTSDAVVDDQRGAVFPTTLVFARDTIDVDGKAIRLRPGLNVTAEIKTGKRRVIEFLLSPVQRVVTDSMKER